MTSLVGRYFNGSTSQLRTVTVALSSSAELTVVGDGVNFSCDTNDVRVSSRVGNSRRHLYFNDGSQIETDDNDAVDRLFSGGRGQAPQQLLHRWESRIGYVAAAFFITVIVIWLGITYAIPELARRIAFSLPPATERILGQQALSGLDRLLLQPSQLAIERQAALQAVFKGMTLDVKGAPAYQLVFRSSRQLGPNALALPSGIVVLTDSLVSLSVDDNELIAVLAHEIGHLQQRHQLRRLLQSSATGLLLVAATGDLSSVASLGTWLPTLLVDSKYSRAFEREADDFSAAFLISHNIPQSALANILQRMGSKSGNAGQLPDYLSSHPATLERIRKFSDN